MSNIELKAGYYEWNAYVDGKHYFTFGDIGELLWEDMKFDEEENGVHKNEPDHENLENIIELCLFTMDMIHDEQGIDRLDMADMLKLRREMCDKWTKHYIW